MRSLFAAWAAPVILAGVCWMPVARAAAMPPDVAAALAEVDAELHDRPPSTPKLYTKEDLAALLREWRGVPPGGRPRPARAGGPEMEGRLLGAPVRQASQKRLLLETAFQMEALAHQLDLANLADEADEVRKAASSLRATSRRLVSTDEQIMPGQPDFAIPPRRSPTGPTRPGSPEPGPGAPVYRPVPSGPQDGVEPAPPVGRIAPKGTPASPGRRPLTPSPPGATNAE